MRFSTRVKQVPEIFLPWPDLLLSSPSARAKQVGLGKAEGMRDAAVQEMEAPLAEPREEVEAGGTGLVLVVWPFKKHVKTPRLFNMFV